MTKQSPKQEVEKPTTNRIKDVFSFAYKMTQILFGLAIVGLGAAGIIYGLYRAPELWQYVLIICGACTFVDGWVVLWKVAK